MIFLQPTYVKNFKCDGKRCGAQCCKRWIIDIDEETFDSYKNFVEITSKITFSDERNSYVTKLDENNCCQFLDEDNLCTIQKNYGENFLSMICQTFPRHIVKIGDFCERSLNLTCPLAAEMALTNPKMDFEMIEEVSSPDLKIGVQIPMNIDEKLLPFITEIQMTAIFILQTRTLTIDQRLAALGIYFERLEKIISEVEKISDLTEIFTSKDFFKEINLLLSDVTFNPQNFLQMMLEVDIKEVAVKNFIELSGRRKNFINNFSVIFENYLVHEFFLNLYPFRFSGTIMQNYGVFVASYKIVAIALFHSAKDVNDVIKGIVGISNRINHTQPYLEKIMASVKNSDSIRKIISTFLQTKGNGIS